MKQAKRKSEERGSRKGRPELAQGARAEHRTPEGKPFKELHSWNTDDDYQIELRRVRAMEEAAVVTPAPRQEELFRDYHVSGKNSDYLVELRSLEDKLNTCTCPDFQKNFLGTCKHIEHVLQAAKGCAGQSPYYEIFMKREPFGPCLLRPAIRAPKVSALMNIYFDRKGEMLPGMEPATLLQSLDALPEDQAAHVRLSWEVRRYAERRMEKARLAKLEKYLRGKVQGQNGELPFLKGKLYDYQLEGMYHLAFHGRAILADDMGLGKTVQAVAAAAVMQQMLGVRRVLVVSPTSLKLEWEEQIRKFTDLSCEAVFGNRMQRLQFYQETSAFFILMNYEQVLRDSREIMDVLHPDLMILDEAQRIKNWNTQTARTLKEMQTPYVFVLTGTPLENRIDDIYSLSEIVEPALFGSLFRFNRRYYRFDAEGRNIGMQNLEELHARLKPILLRRRKADVKMPLPKRSDRNLYIPMTAEQQARYSEAQYRLNILLQIMKRRPLNQEEFQRMQLLLANMRMLCDSCYITDPEIKEAPKLEEAMALLQEYFETEPRRKIIIFSEWVRMLDLLKERLEEEGIPYVEHTGSIPQLKRRAMLAKFKNDPSCRILLSSEAGGTGLNLQVASVVFNLDLPWNPARLEQRIARAWRNKQNREVEVVNFVAENTIEQNMLGTLQFKSGLAELVLDGSGDESLFTQKSAKEAFLKRLQDLMASPQKEAHRPPAARIKGSGLAVEQLFSFQDKKGQEQLLEIGAAPGRELGRIMEDSREVTVLSPENMALLRQLEQLGLISIHDENLKCLYDAKGEPAAEGQPVDSETLRRVQAAKQLLEDARRPMKMAGVLLSNDFPEEAADAVWKASSRLEQAIAALLYGQVSEESAERQDMEALRKMLEATKLDGQSRKFLELSHARLNGREDNLLQQCEDALASIGRWAESMA